MAWIYGGAQDVEFMEKLAIAVAALGGQPLVYLFSDVTMHDWYREVPERFDTMRDRAHPSGWSARMFGIGQPELE